jgi:hypothetical protein
MKIFKGLKMLDLNLFGTLPKFLMRRDAPETSKESAVRVDSQTLEKIVYEVIRSHPEGCISDDVLETLKTMPYGSVTARYSALKRKKLIEVTGEKRTSRAGRPQYVMRAV